MKRVLFLFLILIGCIVEVLSNDSSKSLTFSMPHGFYETDKIEVAITGGAEGAIIRYTTDGSVPTINSPIYTKPFTLTCTTILRAVEDVGGAISKPVTSSYILSNSVLNQNNTPAGYPETWGRFLTIDGIAPADYEMDTTITKVSQTEIERSLKNLPIVSLSTEMENLFSDALDEEKGGIYVYTGAKSEEKELPGRGWERPVTLEIIGGKQHHDLIVDGCLKIHGGSSRIPEQNPKHAFRVHFKSKYGPSKLTYNLFGEKESFDALVLRTFYNFSWQHCNPPQQV